MAVPGPNQFTSPPVPAPFLAPLTDDYDPLTMRATGGVAIGDGTQGREVQFWTITYDGVNILIKDSGGITQYTLAVDGVLSVCLAFDANMAVAIAYMRSDGGYLYFFNSLLNAYQTLYFANITSCRVCVDKTTAFYSGSSDVIFSYVTDGTALHYRIQRDRYAIEYSVTLPSVITTANPLIKAGPSTGNRLQFELVVVGPPPPPPPPPPPSPVLAAAHKLPLPTLPVVRVVKVDPVYN